MSFKALCKGDDGDSLRDESCNWVEKYPITLLADKITGGASRPMTTDRNALKFDTAYSIFSFYMFEDLTTDSVLVEDKSFTEMMVMEWSSATQSLLAVATAIISVYAF